MTALLRDLRFSFRQLRKNRMAPIGLTLGLGGAYFVGRATKSAWYEAGAIHPLSVVLVALLLLLSALFACYVPARRAMRVDPLVALRQE
jgi:ABC-type transport system, involved in lipoprotein release, permease component